MDAPAQQAAAKSKDKYDAMALIAGRVAGLRSEQLPGLAHIFRQIAKDEREVCAKIVEDEAKSALQSCDDAAWWVEDMLNKLAEKIRDSA